VKVSVSLPPEDVSFLDEYARSRGGSRSAAVHEAVRRLRHEDLVKAYDEANDEWAGSADAALWERTAGDGLG
jgi:Arc/MetJ-type ribon-helix-helix transcriptional regulator